MPPVNVEYQLIEPALAVAFRITVPAPQMVPSVIPVIVGVGIIVAITAVLLLDVQFPPVTST